MSGIQKFAYKCLLLGYNFELYLEYVYVKYDIISLEREIDSACENYSPSIGKNHISEISIIDRPMSISYLPI